MWFGRECQFDALVSLWKIGYRVEKPPSNRQANDFKRALRGRQPTHLIAFCLFSFVLSRFVGNCPSKIQRKRRKIFEPKLPEAWHIPCLQWHGRATPCLATPPKSRTLARPMPVVARSCLTSTYHIPNFFSFFSLHSSTQTSLIPSTTLYNLHSHKTFKPPYLPQFSTKSQKFFTQTIQNNFHPSKPKFTQIPIPH